MSKMPIPELKDYQAPDDLLAGRNILITGAGRGIGRTAALSFAAHGATVILIGALVHQLEELSDEIVDQGYPQPALFPMDLQNAPAETYLQLADALDREIGRLDGLLHNAGELGVLTTIENYDPELWDKVMQINLHAPFLLTRACLPLLLASDDASLVFTSSSVGRTGKAYWGAYGVSMFAIEGMMQTLADELEQHDNIRINSINPGAVRTRMRMNAFPAENPASVTPPEAIMPAYLYLFGKDSRGVSGQALKAQA